MKPHELPLRKKELWNTLATDNAMKSICILRPDWDVEEFFEHLKQLVKHLCLSYFQKMGFDPRGKKALDLACGIGRTTRFFAKIFGEAYGADISKEMMNRAKELHRDRSNLHFDDCNRIDLRMYADNSFDFVFYFLTFQHIDRRRIIRSYIHETDRVLKPGGLFQLQFHNKEQFHAFGFIPVNRLIYKLVESGMFDLYFRFRHLSPFAQAPWAYTRPAQNQARC